MTQTDMFRETWIQLELNFTTSRYSFEDFAVFGFMG